jgi:hypothetical protein
MSKFEFDIFYGDDGTAYAVNAEKYTEEQARELLITHEQIHTEEWDCSRSWVTHRAGIDGDGEPSVGWWVDPRPYKRSCPAWIFEPNEIYRERLYGKRRKE